MSADRSVARTGSAFGIAVALSLGLHVIGFSIAARASTPSSSAPIPDVVRVYQAPIDRAPPPRREPAPEAGEVPEPPRSDPVPEAEPSAPPEAPPPGETDSRPGVPDDPLPDVSSGIGPSADPAMSEPTTTAPPPTGACGFAMALYGQDVMARLRANFQFPDPGRRVTSIGVEIARDGGLARHWIIDSSGDPLHDEAARRALERSLPFPPIPSCWRAPTLARKLDFGHGRSFLSKDQARPPLPGSNAPSRSSDRRLTRRERAPRDRRPSGCERSRAPPGGPGDPRATRAARAPRSRTPIHGSGRCARRRPGGTGSIR